MTNHPITPTSELVHQWHREACRDPYNGGAFFRSKTLEYIATQAAKWGWQQRDASVADELQKARDEELDACCEWLEYADEKEKLRAARRPKPKTLVEDALKELAWVDKNLTGPHLNKCDAVHTIRRALEHLQELEDNQ